MKNLTMQQIADELGVSRLTVSSVINDTAEERRISKPTVKRVRKYMEERGYVPSRQAVSLKSGQKDAVGILYCGTLYSHLTGAFNQLNGLFCDKPGSVENMIVARPNLVDGVRELLARGVSKLIWIHTLSARKEIADPVIHNYLARFDTVVMYNFHFRPNDGSGELIEKGYHLVGVDRLTGYRNLAVLLKTFGHNKVALPDMEMNSVIEDEFRTVALDSEGIKVLPTMPAVKSPGNPQAAGAAMTQGVIEAMRTEGISAAVTNDDEQAGHLMQGLLDHGVRIPQDITITGYDNMPFSGILQVPLTTLGVPTMDMVACIRTILRQGMKKKIHCFEMELIERGSHARASVR